MSEQMHKSEGSGLDPSCVVAVVSAFVSHNALPQTELPAFIASVHAALSQVVNGAAPAAAGPIANDPAVPVKKSVTKDFIICLEDGHKFKSLKRHLSTRYGLTPEAYRAKWGLPHDYPMVAPAYAAHRSELAKKSGLGVKAQAARAAGKAKRKPTAKAKLDSQAA